jgi:hypothetical protein
MMEAFHRLAGEIKLGPGRARRVLPTANIGKPSESDRDFSTEQAPCRGALTGGRRYQPERSGRSYSDVSTSRAGDLS